MLRFLPSFRFTLRMRLLTNLCEGFLNITLIGLLTMVGTLATASPQGPQEIKVPLKIGVLHEGGEEIKTFLRASIDQASPVLTDKVFRIESFSVEELAQLKDKDYDYVLVSGPLYPLLEEFRGYRALNSIVSDNTGGYANYASAALLLARQPNDSNPQTINQFVGKRIALPRDEGLDAEIGLKNEFVLRHLSPHQEVQFIRVPERLPSLLDALAHGQWEAVVVSALNPQLPPAWEERFNIVEPRLNDYFQSPHTSLALPGWVLAANVKESTEDREMFSNFLLSLGSLDGKRWVKPADYRIWRQILTQQDWDVEDLFHDKSFLGYVQENKGIFTSLLLGIVLLLLHYLRVERLLRRKTKELNEATAEKLTTQAQFHYLEKSRIVGQISTVVSHELKQPLAAIQNYARGLKRRLGHQNLSEQDLLYALERLSQESQRANDILYYVQNYAKGDRNAREALNVSQYVQTLTDSYTDSLNQPLLDTTIEPDLWLAMDPRELELIVRNLISNALEASRHSTKGWIRVGLQRTHTIHAPLTVEQKNAPQPNLGPSIELFVEDNGPALTPEAFERLSRPLHSGKIGGLGLGLSIVQGLVESYGGHLSFSQRTPQGLKVTVCLPMTSLPSDASTLDRRL